MPPDVLIVDDEEDICDFLKEEFKELNLEADFALTGEEALRKIEGGKWKMFVIDLKLSTRVTGLDVIKAARSQLPEATVIVMTGYMDIGLKQDVERLGVKAFLRKPDDVQPDVFRDKIQSLLRAA